jgi:pimeloyl-ACP methyl ester carboxylesterase
MPCLLCVLLLSGVVLAAQGAVPSEPLGEPRDLVILVHGMGRTRFSMRPLQRALEAEGYEVISYGYPSRRARVAELGPGLADRIEREEARADVARVHLVGHSLGNILIRWTLANRRPAKLGRVVMLAPPNQGARWADYFAGSMSWFSKPLTDLTTSPTSTARTLPTPQGVEIGVIAGSRDITVRLPETMLEGQTDHVVVPSGHTFIMRRRIVHRLTIRFLRTGAFLEAPS